MGIGYQWLLDYDPESPAVFSGGGQLPVFIGTMAVVAGVFALPPVAGAMGLTSLTSAAIIGQFTAWFVLLNALRPWVRRSRVLFHVLCVMSIFVASSTSLAFVVLGGDPRSPTWAFPIVYAAINGGITESRPSLVFLLVHILLPLATLPVFASVDSPWSVAGPVVCAGLSAALFHYMASRGAVVRRLQAERAGDQLRLRDQQAELDRLRLARDLHDSLGSSLGLLRMYADLLEREAPHPDEIRRLAALVREAAAGGLGDLRGTLEALSPTETTVAALVEGLRTLGGRIPNARVSVEVTAGAEVELPPAVRLALVRVFQELVRNAIEHGAARNVRARLEADSERVVLAIDDDGRGFDPAAASSSGRGLPGMARRAAELGGRFALESKAGGGTCGRLELPLGAGRAAA